MQRCALVASEASDQDLGWERGENFDLRLKTAHARHRIPNATVDFY